MLQEKLNADLKEALKTGDTLKVSTLRFLLAAVHNREIELRGSGKKLTDEEILGVIGKQVKQHRESVESFEKGGRPELVEKEKAELAILQSYLPQQLGEEEIRSRVKEAIEQSAFAKASADRLSNKDMGTVMKAVMPPLKGQADGAVVRRVVEEELGKVSSRA